MHEPIEAEQIRLTMLDLQPGETRRMVCPFCKAEHEHSMVVTRLDGGQALVYKCWRAKCGISGVIGSKSYDPHWENNAPKKKTPKPFDYETEELPQSLKDMFYVRYDITEDELEANGFKYVPETNRVAMPIYNFLGYQIGTVARSYASDFTGTKAINYFDDGESHLHYVPSRHAGEREVVCVEDIPSAIRVARQGRAIALLGSHITETAASELSSRFHTIRLALDPDATYKALKLKKQYSLYFRNFLVRVLSKDPKDMTDQEIQEEIFS